MSDKRYHITDTVWHYDSNHEPFSPYGNYPRANIYVIHEVKTFSVRHEGDASLDREWVEYECATPDVDHRWMSTEHGPVKFYDTEAECLAAHAPTPRRKG